jgi:two-component system, chemotaxis family, CheB/CheR fusion protein
LRGVFLVKKTSHRNRKGRSASSPSSAFSGKASTLDKLFPVVGVGASAGGLEAFTTLLANLPDSTGMAFVLLQHLDPSHTSALEEILSRATRIPVTEATNGLPIERRHIYLLPPNHDMVIRDGILRLSARTLTHGQHRPIDHFFVSLAEDCGDRAIAVILSGTASDGTSGCLAIKAVGGITLAQDEASAKYASMPKSAVEAGCIDFVLPPKAIAEELARIERHPYIARIPTRPDELLGPASPSDIHALFALLREAKGVDFTHYKQSTLQRRIKRRMVLNQVDRLEDYLRFVKRTPKELDELYRDILIHVTGFFRVPDAFDALRKTVFPALTKNRKPSDWPIRVWIPGCSTGEEAYSMAIALLEYMGPNNANVSAAPNSRAVQIFATDISDDVLDRARAGVYPQSAVADLPPSRLNRFFTRVDKGYQVLQSVREACIFAKQNIAKDPPFSGLDLISCRNLLIYLGPELQKRVIPTMHYALKPGAYLMLGGAESLGVFSDYFTLVDKKYKIYQKKTTSARLVTYFTGVDYSLRRRGDAKSAKVPAPGMGIEKEVERELVNRFVPASIVVNSEWEIVQFRGKTGAYLEPAAGHPTFSLSKMAREGLLVDLRAALNTAKKENVPVRKERVSIQSDAGTRDINFEVIPIRAEASQERFYVVVFQDAPPKLAAKTASKRLVVARESRKGNPLARQNERLAREVRQLRSQLQSLIEEHETTSEEFKTANEEVLSSNEELQSANEELETAKEELQSSNEELNTVNEELQNRNVELSTANNDLLNVFANVNIPVVIVNNDIHIRRFTPAAEKLLNLLPSDIGRYLGEIRPNIETENLDHIARQTVETISPREAEVRDTAGVWYLMRCRPYKTPENKVEGAVISFIDIHAIKRVVEETRAYADALIETAREAIVILDANFRVVVANPAFYNSFAVSPSDTVNRLIFDLGNHQWDIPALRTLLEKITRQNVRIDDFEVRHNFERIGERVMLLNARRLSIQQSLIFLSIEDVTDRHRANEALERQAALLDLAHDTVMVRALKGEILFWNRGAEEMYGWDKEYALGKTTHQLLRTQFPKPFSEIEEDLRRSGHWEGELVHATKMGATRIVNSRWALLEQNNAEPVILEINTDISDRKRSEETLRRLSAYLMTLQDEERRRIARELHDSTGQKLAAAKLQLDTLVKSGNLKSHEQALRETVQWIDECFQEVRTLSQLLHPPLLDEAGLISATRWVVDGFSSRSNIQVDLQIAGEIGRLPQPIELALFRVIQESLSNIHRHSGARKAQIKLARADGGVSLEIRDNGKGMPPELLSGSNHGKQVVGVGILGMRERLSQLGGTLEIESNKNGTTVKVSVPVAAAASQQASLQHK